MSVINRIEIASLLNKHGDVSSPWEAKMRHLMLNLRGQSTAMNMENGFGKTTLSDALIGMLSRNQTLITKTRRKMSPSRDGHPWSHIRVEFSYTSCTDAQTDILTSAGDSVGGEHWVFGMYGHSDTDAGYYFFQGRLEELPIHSITADHKLQLFSNEHVRQALRQLKTEERPKDRESWLDAISLHISRKELEQLASFQKEGGADKSQIFNAIKPRPGEKADQAFFYEVLAPQILAGASHGETDESEEFIEELVINSGQKVSELRHQIQENSKDLARNDTKKSRLEELNKAAGQLESARQERDQCREQLSDQAACMAVLASQGIPGIPVAGDHQTPEMVLAREMAVRVGETSPLVPLSALADITSTSARKIETWFENRQLSCFRHDKTALVYYPDANWNSGKSMRFYPADKVRTLLADSHDLFRDDHHRLTTLELLDDAADSFFDLDSNPFRENYLADQSFKDTLGSELADLKTHKRSLEEHLETLRTRDKEFTDNETVYTDALKEGLFSEAELNTPDETEKSANQLKDAISRDFEKFLQTEGRFSVLVDKWAQFQRQYGSDNAPVDILQEKELRIEALDKQLRDCHEQEKQLQSRERGINQQLQAVGTKLPRLQQESNRLSALKISHDQIAALYPDEVIAGLTQRLEAQQQALRTQNQTLSKQHTEQENRLENLVILQDDHKAFRSVFPDQQPEGLEEYLSEQQTELSSAVQSKEKLVSNLERLLSDLLHFRQEFPENDPGQWLAMASERFRHSLTGQDRVKGSIADIERQLSDLESDPVSPGAVEDQCTQLLKTTGLEPQPLHQVITELMPEGDARTLSWLTQAHNLLFAPVLLSEADAKTAAHEFARQRLPVPVFTRDALQKAADNQSATILGAATGYESLAVKSLLDPSFIEERKQQLADELAEHQQKLQDLEQALELYDPNSIATLLARSAAEAMTASAESELPVQQINLTEQQIALQAIKNQLSFENRKLIRSAEQFEQQGGDTAIADCKELLQQCQVQLEQVSGKLRKLEEQLSGDARRTLEKSETFVQEGGEAQLNQVTDALQELTIRQEQLSEQYEQSCSELEQYQKQRERCRQQISEVYQPGEKDRLATLDNYLEEGGPGFMANANERKAELTSQKHRAECRANLNFKRLRAYLSARDDQQGSADLKKQIASLQQQLKKIEADQEHKREAIERINTALLQLPAAIRQVDETAHRWLGQLAWFSPETLHDLSSQDLEKLESMPLYEKAENYRNISNEDEIDAILASAEALSDQLELENTQELHRELKHREKAHDDKQGHFLSVLGRILDTDRHWFNATELTRLNHLEQADNKALADLGSMIATIGEQLVKSRERQTLLEESMLGNEEELQKRLSSIILHSVDNLKILKKVASQSSGDNAYFVIDADIVSEDGVLNLVRSLLAEIEEDQRKIRSRKAKNLPVGSEKKQKEDLQSSLRSQIYRQLFTNIRIRLKHEAIRSHGNLFSLNEDMSEGQREALSLMWLVKLSEFAIERELRTVSSQYRRKERKSGESVVILDGLFSKLSNKQLIEDSLESLRNTRGRFQMIGLIHNPNYENDPDIFPTYLVGNVIGGQKGGHVTVKEGVRVSPKALGRSKGEASLFHLHVEHEGIS